MSATQGHLHVPQRRPTCRRGAVHRRQPPTPRAAGAYTRPFPSLSTAYTPLPHRFAAGGWPAADGAVLSHFPQLAPVLPAMHAHAAAAAPQQVTDYTVVETLDGLLQQVADNASFW